MGSNTTFPNGENIFDEILGINLQNLFDETTSNASDNSNTTFPNGENIFEEILGINLQNLFDETTNNASNLSPSIDGQPFHTIPVGGNILVEAPVDLQGVDRELNYNETTHHDNNSYATSDSHTTSVIQGDTDGGTGGSVAPTPSARAPFKRPAPAPKDSKTSESSPKRPRETRDPPDIESKTPFQKPPPEAPPAPNTGFSPNTTTGTDSISTSVTEPTTNITIQINTDTGSSLNRTPGADPKNPMRCRVYRQNKKSEEVEQHQALLQCLKRQRELKAVEADLKNPGSSTARDAVSTSKPLKIEVLDEPCGSVGSNNDDNKIYIVT